MTTEQDIRNEIENLEEHGESCCPECSNCIVCNMVTEKKAELKGYLLSQSEQADRIKKLINKIHKHWHPINKHRECDENNCPFKHIEEEIFGGVEK